MTGANGTGAREAGSIVGVGGGVVGLMAGNSAGGAVGGAGGAVAVFVLVVFGRTGLAAAGGAVAGDAVAADGVVAGSALVPALDSTGAASRSTGAGSPVGRRVWVDSVSWVAASLVSGGAAGTTSGFVAGVLTEGAGDGVDSSTGGAVNGADLPDGAAVDGVTVGLVGAGVDQSFA